jgi:hypothetical protein
MSNTVMIRSESMRHVDFDVDFWNKWITFKICL